MSADYEVDVAVVGAGACGMMAALKAAEAGAGSVAVFEKSTRAGCNTEFSSGSLAAAGTRWQREAGVADDPAATPPTSCARAGIGTRRRW